MADLSYSKNFRLLSASDFSYLKAGCKSLSRPWIRVYYKRSRIKSSETRIGFSVSKKVGKANVRNRVKRLFKESFRCSSSKYLGLDILFVVSPNIFKKVSNKKVAESYLLNSFGEIIDLVSKEKAN